MVLLFGTPDDPRFAALAADLKAAGRRFQWRSPFAHRSGERDETAAVLVFADRRGRAEEIARDYRAPAVWLGLDGGEPMARAALGLPPPTAEETPRHAAHDPQPEQPAGDRRAHGDRQPEDAAQRPQRGRAVADAPADDGRRGASQSGAPLVVRFADEPADEVNGARRGKRKETVPSTTAG